MSFSLDVIDKLSALITAAFGLVAALAWNSAIQQIFKEISDIGRSNGVPNAIVVDAFDSARSVQREAVTAMGKNTLQQDENDGYQALLDGLSYIESGQADAYFYGMPEEKESLIADYKAAIAGYEEDVAEYLGTTPGEISKADSKLVSEFKKRTEDLENRLSLGAITGKQAMGELESVVTAYQASLATSAGQNSLLVAKQKFVSDNFDKLPSSLKTEAEGVFDSFMLSTGINVDSKKLTPEQQRRINDTENYYMGTVLDLMFEAGRGNISAADLTSLVQKANEGYLLSAKLLDSEGNTKAVLATDEGVISTANKKNLDIIDRIWRDGAPDSLVYLDDLAGYGNTMAYDKETGAVSEVPNDPTRRPVAVFFSPGVQQTYDTLGMHFKPQLSDATGVPVDRITYSPYVFTTTSEALPLPMYTVNKDDGTVDNYIIQDGYFKKWNAEANKWDERLGYEIQKNGDTPKPVDPQSGVGQGTPKELVEGNPESDFTRFIHVGRNAASVDPEIVDMPGFDMKTVLDLVNRESVYSEYRDFIRDELYRYWNNKQNGIPKEEW